MAMGTAHVSALPTFFQQKKKPCPRVLVLFLRILVDGGIRRWLESIAIGRSGPRGSGARGPVVPVLSSGGCAQGSPNRR